jgi:hypothetical protein
MSIGRALLDATDGGLNIFKKYIENAFEVDEMVELEDARFKVTWNDYHKNYAVYIDEYTGSEWINSGRFNAVWFVKERFDLNANAAREKIDTEMNLGVISAARKRTIEKLLDDPVVEAEQTEKSTSNPLGLIGVQ